ncbi:hypothetical protein BDQ12DRAFT_759840 [Crucibulum laeve]|uniref:Uncharacterized protein n=1 Tax=Crucibulum laeve TaxID=68775 RepID=A0A5C3LRW1_9AGAR|nr:hypothetical protein BDQ12DRAFT_759840 [Crucibulum laeve]
MCAAALENAYASAAIVLALSRSSSTPCHYRRPASMSLIVGVGAAKLEVDSAKSGERHYPFNKIYWHFCPPNHPPKQQPKYDKNSEINKSHSPAAPRTLPPVSSQSKPHTTRQESPLRSSVFMRTSLSSTTLAVGSESSGIALSNESSRCSGNKQGDLGSYFLLFYEIQLLHFKILWFTTQDLATNNGGLWKKGDLGLQKNKREVLPKLKRFPAIYS